MMKISIFLFLLIGLIACSQPEEAETGYGYLELEKVTFQADGELIPLSRAVDAGLQVQIWRNGTLVEGQDYAPGADFNKRIVLPVGTGYQVKAFTPDQEEAATDIAGHPVYKIESESFEVKEADITTLTLVAPQVNVGVAVSYDEVFKANFKDISLTIVSESGRTVTILGTEDQNWRYFNLPSSGRLTYTLHATNADGELLETTELLAVTAKNYTIQIAI